MFGIVTIDTRDLRYLITNPHKSQKRKHAKNDIIHTIQYIYSF